MIDKKVNATVDLTEWWPVQVETVSLRAKFSFPHKLADHIEHENQLFVIVRPS